MREEIVDELEEFVRRGMLWHPEDLGSLVARLEGESEVTGDPLPRTLANVLRSLLLRMGLGDVPPRLASEVEGIVYPRLWKVMEAVRDGMPDAEIRIRIEVFSRRLSRTFAEEP